MGYHDLRKIISSELRNFEEEKKSIAREIHDGPLQLNIQVNKKLKELLEETDLNDEMADKVSLIQNLAEEANYQLRVLCTELRPASLNDLGLITAVDYMCQELMKRELITISLTVRGMERDLRLQEDIEISAFRFLQEGLSNVLKHSGASQADVQVILAKGNLELMVKDSGKGFDLNKLKAAELTGIHLGLVGMRERIDGLGGNFKIKTKPGCGVELMAIIPINQ